MKKKKNLQNDIIILTFLRYMGENKKKRMYLEDYTYIQEYLQGNEGAFEILYKKYRKPLYSYLNRLIPGQSQLADDIYQQAWIKAIDNLHNYKEQGTFLAWMMRISHHLFVDYCRKEAKKKTVYSEVFYENTQTNNKSIITEEFNEAYKNALAQLNDQQR
ncbi:MAG: RNA polymerase sigma factor, partial [Verrucomicrobiota bacterium]|nr:RNA polymerase sigma factor [Verrucomicrobiota bacterium]